MSVGVATWDGPSGADIGLGPEQLEAFEVSTPATTGGGTGRGSEWKPSRAWQQHSFPG